MRKLFRISFIVLIAVLALAITVLSPAVTGYAADIKTGEIAEVAAELHPSNEVMRELHPDMYKSQDTVGIYGTGKYKTPPLEGAR